MGSRDSRRIIGPEKSQPYSIFQPPENITFLGDHGVRRDGRTAIDPRKLFMTVGVISQAKGSSYVEVGNTKVCCGVYGPKGIERGNNFNMSCKVLCEVKMVPFSCRVRRQPQPDTQQREMSKQLQDTLESVIILDKFPKSQIDVYVTVVEDDGSLLGACTTAAGLALAHANIDLYDLVVGTSLLWHEGILYVDPTRHEEEKEAAGAHSSGSEGGQLTVGMMPTYASGQVGLLVQSGQVTADNLCEGLEMAVDMCHRLHSLAKKTLLDHVEKMINKDATRSAAVNGSATTEEAMHTGGDQAL